MTPLQREAYICKRAYELARSGSHAEPLGVVTKLVEEGFPEADGLLEIQSIRDDLRLVCSESQRGRSYPTTTDSGLGG